MAYLWLAVTSVGVSAASTDEPPNGAVIGYAHFLRHQKASPTGQSAHRANVNLRADYLAQRHAEAFARIAETRSPAEIERAFDLLDSVRTDPQYPFWLAHSYYPGLIAPKHRDYMFGEMARALGAEFVGGEPGHLVPNEDMMEYTVALSSGRLGDLELADALPSGLPRDKARARARARRRHAARKLHATALAAMIERKSRPEIEAAVATLHRSNGDYDLERWIAYCYLRGTPGPRDDRRFSAPGAKRLGPEFFVERDGVVEPNEDMVQFTLALTNGRADGLALSSRLPSGEYALDILREDHLRRNSGAILFIGPPGRAAEAALRAYVVALNPRFELVAISDAGGAAEVARRLRDWARAHPARVGMVVIDGAGLGSPTAVAPWSGRPALMDALAPLRGHLAEDAQIVATSDRALDPRDPAAAEAWARALLEDLGAARGSVTAMTTDQRSIPGFADRTLADARIATASLVANGAAAVLNGVTDANQALFTGALAPLLYLAVRPLYAAAPGSGLAVEHPRDWAAALGAGVAVLLAQTAASGDLASAVSSVGIGGVALGLAAVVQYGAVSIPRRWRARGGRLNQGLRLTIDDEGRARTESLRTDLRRETIFSCASTLTPRPAEARPVNLSVVR